MGRTKGALNKKTLEQQRAQQSIHMPLQNPAAVLAPVTSEVPTIPQAVPRPVLQFIEYFAPSGEKWRAERGRALLADFELFEEQMPLWHECLLLEKRIADILRSFYGIAPLVGGDPEFLKPKSLADIGSKIALSVEQVQSEIDAGKTYWKKWFMQRNTAATSAAKTYSEDLPKLEASMSKDMIERLLRLHGFEDLLEAGVSEGDQLFAAERIRDLQNQLEDSEGRTIARSAIRMELQLNMYDRMISRTTRESDDRNRNAVDRAASFKQLQNLIDNRQQLSESHGKTMEKLNLTQAQTQSLKAKTGVQDCLGSMMKAVMEYDARGDTTLVDGIFTALEIRILITPLSIRPQQYRPDIVALANHALERHNLFDPDYVPPHFPRAEFRRFMTAFGKAIQAGAEESGSVIEIEESDNETGEEDESRPEDTPITTMPQPVEGSVDPVEMAAAIRKRNAGDDFATG